MRPSALKKSPNHRSAGLPLASGGIYVHIPFCLSKCDYCSFASQPASKQTNFTPYINAVIKHARKIAVHQENTSLESLFIGGGTPTIIPHDLLCLLIKTLGKLFNFSATPEITVEANPNTLDHDSLAALHDCGVNRLSIGVQSFSDDMLKAIGRTHSANDALASLAAANKAGFDNLSLDLIYGLPGQTLSDWQTTLETALGLQPAHISIYELMIEAPSVFAEKSENKSLNLPHLDDMLLMDELTASFTAKNDYCRYEISNYARNDKTCKHNINYWRNGPYIGLGAGAVGNYNGIRLTNVKDPLRYVEDISNDSLPFESGECLCRQASFRESVIMGLRMLKGVDICELEKAYHISLIEYYGERLDILLGGNLLAFENDHLKLTPRGLRLANQVMAELV